MSKGQMDIEKKSFSSLFKAPFIAAIDQKVKISKLEIE